jgi:transposase
MLSFPGSLKVLVAVEPCDMRKGFNGLYTAVSQCLGEDPKTGALFVFSNRRHTRIKILYWDGTGLWLLTKRLERGTFCWPKLSEPQRTKLSLTPQALAMLTDGVDLRGAKLRPWYEREE